MNKNEQDFLNYWYTQVVVNRNTSSQVISEGYYLLKGERLTNNCSSCMKSYMQKLNNTYVTLSKIQSPINTTPVVEPLPVVEQSFEKALEFILDDEPVEQIKKKK